MSNKTLTTEEKAKEIAESLNKPNGSNCLVPCHQAAMAMAKWKEEQIIEKIKEFFSNCPRYLYLDKDVLGNNFLNRELMLEDLLRELK